MYEVGGTWKLSVISTPFCCEPKTAPRKIYLTGEKKYKKINDFEECDVTTLVGGGRRHLKTPAVLWDNSLESPRRWVQPPFRIA